MQQMKVNISTVTLTIGCTQNLESTVYMVKQPQAIKSTTLNISFVSTAALLPAECSHLSCYKKCSGKYCRLELT